ncbi:MAG: hypothetical protein J4N95_05075 [Chloroflexi bacterium]|nr:hypothetical protein [Chloroflexota bacterium]MCI0855211.1 hypothetical protein [Chloroflexota bacterium]MCI0889260.1 hypothetical protein [Chloroflexota bacterium]
MSQDSETVGFLAIQQKQDSGSLSSEASEFMQLIKGKVSSEWKLADEAEQRRLASAGACIDRLVGFLLQVKRLRQHASDLHGRMFPHGDDSPSLMPGMSAAYQAQNACTDFESLLFHGRATLDRLTLFITSEHKQRTDRYPALGPVLENFSHKDRRAEAVLDVLASASSLPGTLTDVDGARSLRSLVTHRTSITEGTTNAFTAHCLEDGQVLLFDCEAMGYPVLGTAHMLAKEVPAVVLLALSEYLEVDSTFGFSEFEPPWANLAVSFSEFVVSGGDGPLMFVCRMLPDGFSMHKERMNPGVLDLARQPDEFKMEGGG